MKTPRLHPFFTVITITALLWTGSCRSATPAEPIHESLAATASPNLPEPSLTQQAQPTPLPPTSNSAPINEVVADLQNLPIDRFFDQSFQLILLRDPEWITAEGLAEIIGSRNDRLTDISDASVRQNQALYRAIYDLLLEYDRNALTPQQQASYDVYAWYLDDLIRQAEFMYYDYPVNPVVVTGIQNQLLYLFTEYHPMQSLEDAQDYLSRLEQVKAKMDQLIEGLRLRQGQGILPPGILIDSSLGDIRNIANSPPDQTPFYQTFDQKLGEIPGISAAEKDELLAQARSAIDRSVLPGYQSLSAALEDLKVNSSPSGGVWNHPDGAAYYQAALRHHTSTEMTPSEIHQLGLDALEDIQAEMRQRFAALGYPQGDSIEHLYQRLAQDSGFAYGSQNLQQYESLIQEAGQKLDGVFASAPDTELIVEGYPGMVAFYASPALDGSRPGVFYVPLQGPEPLFKIPTVAYHEGIPGHHFQISLARQLDLPLFRNVVAFNAYTEGWALYAEHLAWELGWYEQDAYADLGRLQMEAFRAARLVVDTGLHADQWTFEQAVDFMVENTSLERGFIQSEVVRYLAWPGQATSYAVGYFRLLELRQKAMDRLGDRFDLAQFHQAVLQGGSLPLSLLEREVDAYITLASLEKISEFPLYVMRYEGDYGFSAFLDQLTPQLSRSKELPLSIDAPWACTGFAALHPGGDVLFGRNFDWHLHPALLLFTNPPHGFPSVSMVDISYLDYTQDQPAWQDRRNLLRAPYLPFDGMNSAGLAVGMMAVPEADTGADPSKPTLSELQIIRLLLDNASNVDEALSLLGSYNIDFGGGPALHYFIADSSGRSAVVEFVRGEMRLLPNQQPWQVSTNFLLSEEQPSAADSSCWRYNTAYRTLQASDGQLSEGGAMSLLEDVSQSGDYPTIWSIVYNLSNREFHLAVGRDYQQVYDFSLDDHP